MTAQNTRTAAVWGVGVSIQIAILKVLASHGSGRATLDSLKHDLAILSSSGPEWQARIKRLASRVRDVDIFSNGYVVRDADGWKITQAGRDFLQTLEAVTQDNRAPAPVADVTTREGALIVVGHRFKTNARRPRDLAHTGTVRRGPISEQR
ncbi:aminoacyl-tRNA deacylase [Bradyrhizobium jicamae]|uniref:aminoacyl-tRNA deacylase n=1 Tax=Bradyrhizobium jicamae TaxID=280332 RepID=UPI001BA6B49E|nr:aminoacyl-tRNA deacylase [Bradyrhizobium jicamae]MBR0757128.1 aminoacyl-tRNA deacylase [Bradyrhizobium jicamae]